MTDKLSLYNDALRMVGEPKLSTTTDNRPERYALDSIWDEDPILEVLEESQWTFATRSMEWNYDASVDPAFGYQYGFTKPDDYIRTVAICYDESYLSPITKFEDENNYWYAETETIYIKYTSKDSAYGKDYSLWTRAFKNAVAARMAHGLAIHLAKSQSMQENMERQYEKTLKKAISMDGMNKPTRFLPPGNWTQARLGNSRYKSFSSR